MTCPYCGAETTGGSHTCPIAGSDSGLDAVQAADLRYRLDQAENRANALER